MRAFIAIEPPTAMVEELADVAHRLGAVVPARFLPRETYHVTAAFMGEIGEAAAADAIEVLQEACRDVQPVRLRPVGLGAFGRGRDVTLHVELAAEPMLMQLVDEVRTALRARGIALDEKAFLPHVTLARCARLPEGTLPHIVLPAPRDASRIGLFKSTLTPSGAVYKTLYTEHMGYDESSGSEEGLWPW